jgi:transcription antitermination protein NusB
MQALYQFDIQKITPLEILDDTLSKSNYIDDTINFTKTIYLGILDNETMIDDLIKEHSIDWSFDRIASIDKAILRIGIWELLYSDTSVKIIIAEAIELIRKYSEFEAIKFVNGLLGSIAAKRDGYKESPSSS